MAFSHALICDLSHGVTSKFLVPSTCTLATCDNGISDPYELTLNHDFWMSLDDLSFLTTFKKFYTYFRQMQWSHLGHNTVENKIKNITKFFIHQGPMKNLVLNT